MSDREKLIELVTEIRKELWTMDVPNIPTENEIIANHLIANGVTVQEWIPVSERLPEDATERVLVAISENQPIGSPRIDTDRYNGSWWIRYGGTVTHWMPLPMPPKDGD